MVKTKSYYCLQKALNLRLLCFLFIYFFFEKMQEIRFFIDIVKGIDRDIEEKVFAVCCVSVFSHGEQHRKSSCLAWSLLIRTSLGMGYTLSSFELISSFASIKEHICCSSWIYSCPPPNQSPLCSLRYILKMQIRIYINPQLASIRWISSPLGKVKNS